MSASSEYYLKLQEEEFNSLGVEEQNFLVHIGMTYTQQPTEEDLKEDKIYQGYRSRRIKAFNDEQDYLFKKRTKSRSK